MESCLIGCLLINQLNYAMGPKKEVEEEKNGKFYCWRQPLGIYISEL